MFHAQLHVRGCVIKKNPIIFFGQCRVKVLKKIAIYAFLKKVKNGENTADQSHLDGQKWSGPPALITSVAATVEEDH
jgi:hypothetical protein